MQNKRQQAIEKHIHADAFANMLGAVIEAIEPGYSRVSLTVTPEMINFHQTTHGGLIFSLGDIAFAAAGNSRGQTAVALNMTISFLKATQAGAGLVAECREVQVNGPIGLYEITVREQPSGELVSQIQATAYRKKEWFIEKDENC